MNDELGAAGLALARLGTTAVRLGAAVTTTCDPFGVYLTALATRFVTIRLKASLSTQHSSGSAGTTTSRSCAPAVARGASTVRDGNLSLQGRRSDVSRMLSRDVSGVRSSWVIKARNSSLSWSSSVRSTTHSSLIAWRRALAMAAAAASAKTATERSSKALKSGDPVAVSW